MKSVSSFKQIALWPHQEKAVRAAVDALDSGGRATIVAACGTGKTRIGAAVAARLVAAGRTLVVVPTLELLTQTLGVYREERSLGHTLVAVCSADEIGKKVGEQIATVTTSPAALTAALHADEPATVLCTYASLPVIAAAYASHQLRLWDLVVVDEAHRTAGALGKPWAAIHHDEQIPAVRRLYMTATPRIYGAADGPHGSTSISMDDEQVFGPVAFRLGFGEAIKLGLLADYRVAVPVVTNEEIHRLLLANPEPDRSDPELLAVQIATLRAAAIYDLRRLITYHSRVKTARAFSYGLHAAQDLLTDDRPDRELWAKWIAGSQKYQQRRETLNQFAGSGDHLAVLANARVLGEGVDVPDTDGVVFADPKESLIDTVQAVGRALRTGGRRNKVATIVIPVFIGPDESAEAVLDTSAYQSLWRTLRALRSHDERLNDWLSQSFPHGDDSEQGATRLDLSWIRLHGVPEPEDFATAITIRTVEGKSAEWRVGFAAARRWHAVHGSLNPLQPYVDDEGVALGRWVHWQRWLHGRGALSAERIAALDQLGITWAPRRDGWDRGRALAAAWFAEYGDLAVPINEVVDGFRLGSWLRNQRTRPGLVTEERRAALAKIDPNWQLPWGLGWHRGLREARLYRAAHGDLEVARTYVAPSGHRLGEWLYAQREQVANLDPVQRDLLDALGIRWQAKSPHEESWQRHLAAAQRFHQQFGHLEVPQKYVDDQGVRVGTFLNNVRRRAGGLAPERKAALDALGIRWTPQQRAASEGYPQA